MSESPTTGGAPDDNLKQKLVMRVAFAGVLIALLLAALAFIDYLGQPAEEPVASGPTFSSPVPVPKKEVSQPVKPADPAATSAPAAVPATPEPVKAPAEGSAAAPAPVADVPPKPVVNPQPVLPPSDAKAQAAPARTATSKSATPAEGTSSQFIAESDKPPAAEPRAQPAPPAAVAPPPAPPRLFSGYAVQAGVFADAQRAEELRAKLTLNGIPSTMEARVQVGPFKTREEAEAAREKMKALGIDGILLPPKGAKR